MALRTYRELDAWQQGIALVERCYKQTRSFPSDERLGPTAQLRRAAVSIPSNVAEGACRLTTQARRDWTTYRPKKRRRYSKLRELSAAC
jgi:hypothetical protein